MRLLFLLGALAVCGVLLLWKLDMLPSLTAEAAKPAMHITLEEAEAAKALKPSTDPIEVEIAGFRQETHALFTSRNFGELEKRAAALRASKATFRNGSWKLTQYYTALECRDTEPEGTWTLFEKLHRDWVAAYPQSVTPRVALAQFLTNYAWKARGSGWAKDVTENGWKLFGERLEAARQILLEARAFPEKDPYWWRVGMTVALGQNWPKKDFDQITDEAVKFEPKFWGYYLARAHSLLPKWQGQPGEWEAYADRAAALPEGPGPEIYARIVIYLRGSYDNIYHESKASWPKTREGLKILRQKYPDSLEILSQTALLAATAEDREAAQAAFKELGETYLPDVWRRPERYVHARHWAQTGTW